MAEFTAKDVQALRQATGAGMMDAKKALEENDGDIEAAAKWLREKGLVKAASAPTVRTRQGAVAVVDDGQRRRHRRAQVRDRLRRPSPTQFTSLVQELADARRGQGRGGGRRRKTTPSTTSRSSSRRTSSSAQVVRFEAADGNVLDTYLHRQDGRGVNARASSSSTAAPRSWPTTSRVHIAFAKPDVPEPRRGAPRPRSPRSAQTLEDITRAEGKPEAALAKIVEGRLNGWFKERVLLEQAYVKDEKRTDRSSCSATRKIVRFAQVVIGG